MSKKRKTKTRRQKLLEEQQNRIETREYLRSVEPWTVPEWNDYARIQQKGKSFRGAPIDKMDLNPDEVYMIEADLRGIISSDMSVGHKGDIRKAFLGVDLTGAKIDPLLVHSRVNGSHTTVNYPYYIGTEYEYNEGLLRKNGKKRKWPRPSFTVKEMSISAARRLDGQDY